MKTLTLTDEHGRTIQTWKVCETTVDMDEVHEQMPQHTKYFYAGMALNARERLMPQIIEELRLWRLNIETPPPGDNT
jgi:hypothetical protein